MRRPAGQFTQAELAAIFTKQRAEEKSSKLTERLKKALAGFRPRKAERGKIVFIGTKGSREAAQKGRRGFAVYIDRKGKKHPVRQYDRKAKTVEKIPIARKLSSVDISRVPSKTAKKRFLETKANKVASGVLSNLPLSRKLKEGEKVGISGKGTRYAGKFETDRIDAASATVRRLGKELVKTIKGTRSKRDFLITIGISCKTRDGRRFWIETQRRFSRRDGQEVTKAECEAFFGKEVYAFLARELAERDLVMQGSARHIARLKGNKGKRRSKWMKDGWLWEGHDKDDVKLERVEWRFDQLTLDKPEVKKRKKT